MPKITKAGYELIVSAMVESRPEPINKKFDTVYQAESHRLTLLKTQEQWPATLNSLCKQLAADNPRFNVDTFKLTCLGQPKEAKDA